MEAQDSEKPKHPERKEQNWRYHTPRWQTILKSHSKQYSLALCLPVEENKPTHMDYWFMTKEQSSYNGRMASSTDGPRKTWQQDSKKKQKNKKQNQN